MIMHKFIWHCNLFLKILNHNFKTNLHCNSVLFNLFLSTIPSAKSHSCPPKRMSMSPSIFVFTFTRQKLYCFTKTNPKFQDIQQLFKKVFGPDIVYCLQKDDISKSLPIITKTASSVVPGNGSSKNWLFPPQPFRGQIFRET